MNEDQPTTQPETVHEQPTPLIPEEAPVGEIPAEESTPIPEVAETEAAAPETAAPETAAPETAMPEAATAEQLAEPQASEPQASEPQAVEQEAQQQPAEQRPQQPTEQQLQKQRENEERRAKAQATWQRLVDAKASGAVVQALVKTPVKGGLLVDIDGYRGFLPASQAGVAKGTPLDGLVGQNVPLKVLDIDETRKRLVVSHRRAQQEERRNARNDLLKSLKVGEEREATVVRLADFGAFVDLGSGIDALIPASELAFERVNKPSDVVKIGEQLKVRVLRIDQGGKKIAVSRKASLHDPWRENASLLQRGKTIEGKVIAKERGLEVEIAPGISGIVSDREANPDEYEVGETVEVTIRNADFRGRRLRLSLAHVAATFTSSSTSFAPLGAELKIPSNSDAGQ